MSEKEHILPQAIAGRLAAARKAKGLSQRRLAKELGVSPQLANHWEKGRAELQLNQLPRICHLLTVPMEWLVAGKGEPDILAHQDEGTTQYYQIKSTPKARRRYEIATEQLIAYLTNQTEAFGSAVGYVISPCSPSAFSTRISDRAMEPRFKVGDRVTLDPELTPEPGDCVGVIFHLSSEFLFGRYKPLTANDQSGKSFSVNFDNMFFEPRTAGPNQPAKIVGTLIEHVSFGSR